MRLMALKAASILWTALCLLHLLLPDEKLKMGMDPALAGLGALAAALPGTAISLCASTDMRCHTTELWSRIFGALLILIALADVLLYSLKLTKEKHQRKKEEDEA